MSVQTLETRIRSKCLESMAQHSQRIGALRHAVASVERQELFRRSSSSSTQVALSVTVLFWIREILAGPLLAWTYPMSEGVWAQVPQLKAVFGRLDDSSVLWSLPSRTERDSKPKWKEFLSLRAHTYLPMLFMGGIAQRYRDLNFWQLIFCCL